MVNVRQGGEGGREGKERVRLTVWGSRIRVWVDEVNFCFYIVNSLHRYQTQTQNRKMPFSKIPMPFFIIVFPSVVSVCMCASVFFFDSLLEYLLCHKSMFLSACTWRNCVKEQIASHTYSLAAIFFTLFVPKRAKSHKQLFILSISICIVLRICLLFSTSNFLHFLWYYSDLVLFCFTPVSVCMSLRNNVPKIVWIYFTERCQRR